MDINFFKNNEEVLVSVPVFAYKALMYTEEDNLDILQKHIIEVIDHYKHTNIDFICNNLGMPDEFKKIVDYEIRSLINEGLVSESHGEVKLNEEVKIKTCELYYILFDKVNGMIIPQPIPAKDFEGKLKRKYFKERYDIKPIVNRPFNDYDEINNEINNICKKYNKVFDVSRNEIGNEIEEINDDFFNEVRMYKGKIYFKEIININNPIPMDFMVKAYRNEEGDIQYEWPFNKTNSSYFYKNLIHHVTHKQLEELIIKVEEEELIKHDEELDSEKIRISVNFRLKGKNSNINQVVINNLCNLRETMEGRILKAKRFRSEHREVIQDMDEILKFMFTEIINKFSKVNYDMRQVSINNIMTSEQIKSITNKQIFKSIKDKRVNLRAGKKVHECIQIRSLLSFFIIIYLSWCVTNGELEKKIVSMFKGNTSLMDFIEEVRMYRNNTVHSIDKSIIYNEKYDLNELPESRVKEILTDLEERLYILIIEIDQITS